MAAAPHPHDVMPDPDVVGTSEYRAVHELVGDVADSAAYDGQEPLAVVVSSLSELADTVRAEQERFAALAAEHGIDAGGGVGL